MPYDIKEKGSKYVVVNTETGEEKAEHDSKEDAERQVRLLHAVENNPNWEEKNG